MFKAGSEGITKRIIEHGKVKDNKTNKNITN
jgi:hypothetical protein